MITLEIDNTFSKITGLDKKTINKMSRRFRVQNAYNEWQNNPSNKYMYFLFSDGRFYTGVLNRVKNYISKVLKEEYTIEDLRDFSGYRDDLPAMKYAIKSMPYPLRQYQREALNKLFLHNRGTVQAATGTGKTFIMAATCMIYNVKTVIICGQKKLAQQLKEEIEDITGEKVGYIGSGSWTENRITVGIVASFGMGTRTGAKKRELIDNLMESTRMVIIDEAHHMQADSYQILMMRFKNAALRYGFTASPFASKIMKAYVDGDNVQVSKERQSEVLLYLHTGPVIFSYGIKEAISDGWLSNVEIELANYEHNVSGESLYGKNFHVIYSRDVVENEDRNDMIIESAVNEVANGGNVVIFVNRIEHGLYLTDEIQNAYQDFVPEDEVAFLHGQLTDKVSSTILKRFREGTIKIMIGTSVMNEGLNFLCTLGINAAAGDSDIAVVQKVGRILRKPRIDGGDVDTKELRNVRFIDISDSKHKWLRRHANSRTKMYKELGLSITETG